MLTNDDVWGNEPLFPQDQQAEKIFDVVAAFLLFGGGFVFGVITTYLF